MFRHTLHGGGRGSSRRAPALDHRAFVSLPDLSPLQHAPGLTQTHTQPSSLSTFFVFLPFFIPLRFHVISHANAVAMASQTMAATALSPDVPGFQRAGQV